MQKKTIDSQILKNQFDNFFLPKPEQICQDKIQILDIENELDNETKKTKKNKLNKADIQKSNNNKDKDVKLEDF